MLQLNCKQGDFTLAELSIGYINLAELSQDPAELYMQGDLLYLNFLVIVLNLSELSQALGELYAG